jgi:hypothetical protein
MFFYKLVDTILCEIKSKWIHLEDFVNFDSSLTNHSLRSRFHQLIEKDGCIFSCKDKKLSDEFYSWLILRNLKLDGLNIISCSKLENKICPLGRTINISKVRLLYFLDGYDTAESICWLIKLCPNLTSFDVTTKSKYDFVQETNSASFLPQINPLILRQLIKIPAMSKSDFSFVSKNLTSLVEMSLKVSIWLPEMAEELSVLLKNNKNLTSCYLQNIDEVYVSLFKGYNLKRIEIVLDSNELTYAVMKNFPSLHTIRFETFNDNNDSNY